MTNSSAPKPTQQSRRAARVAELARQAKRRQQAKIAIIAAAVAIVVAVGVLAFASSTPGATTDAAGQAYVATKDGFRLPGLLDEKKAVSLADFTGKPVVVNFFASWCVYCNEELPGFVQVAKATSSTVSFVGVDSNDSGDGAAMAQRFDLAGAGFHLAHDIGTRPASDLWLAYGSQGLPVTAFYDARGKLVDFSPGMLTQDELAQRIKTNFGIDASAPDAAQLGAPVIPLIPRGAYELLNRTPASPTFAAIDLRSPADFAKGHLAGAINLEASADTVVGKAKSLNPSGSYFLYDASGTNTEATANALHAAGFKHIYFIQGGYAAWASGGFPTAQ
jgi:rhodanese-related sulfurtransferase/thiol-disulfide isomerase/thioredoxin